MSKTVLLLAAFLVVRPSNGFAQAVVSLRDAVRLAVGHDSRVLDSAAKEDRARREADLSGARFGPNLFTGTGAVYTYGFPQTPGGTAPSVLNLAFTETLFDGPAKGRQRAAVQRIEVQRLDAARVRDTTTVETALAYLELAGIRAALDRQRSARRSADAIVDVMASRVGEGRVLPVTVLQARLSSARLGERIAQLEGREIEVEGQVRVLTGIPPGEALQVAIEDLPSLPDRSIAELVALAVANSPELQAARVERLAREQNLAGARRGYWPSVELVGTYAMFSRFNNLDQFYARFQRHNFNVGVEAKVPIFSAETGASVALAQSDVRAADVAIKQQQDRIELDVRRAYQSSRVAAAARTVQEIQLAIAQETIRVVSARVDEGRAERLDLDRAVVDEAMAWDGFYQSEFERQRGQLQLRQITGELSRLFP
jgi:outer membrane protein TolC